MGVIGVFRALITRFGEFTGPDNSLEALTILAIQKMHFIGVLVGKIYIHLL